MNNKTRAVVNRALATIAALVFIGNGLFKLSGAANNEAMAKRMGGAAHLTIPGIDFPLFFIKMPAETGLRIDQGRQSFPVKQIFPSFFTRTVSREERGRWMVCLFDLYLGMRATDCTIFIIKQIPDQGGGLLYA